MILYHLCKKLKTTEHACSYAIYELSMIFYVIDLAIHLYKSAESDHGLLSI